MSHINLVTAVERHFKFKFALGELQKLKNVGDMINLIEAKLAAKEASRFACKLSWTKAFWELWRRCEV